VTEAGHVLKPVGPMKKRKKRRLNLSAWDPSQQEKLQRGGEGRKDRQKNDLGPQQKVDEPIASTRRLGLV